MSDREPQVPVASQREFRVGQVLGLALKILLTDLVKFLAVALIAIVPGVVFALQGGVRVDTYWGVSLADSNYIAVAPGILNGFVIGFGTNLLYALCQAAGLYGAFQDIRGREFDLAKAYLGTLRRVIPIIGLTICALFAVYLGLALFVVPGLMLIARFFVCLPCCVIEGLGPIQSLRRSAELTKGHRWRLFGIFILMVMLSFTGTVINIVFLRVTGPAAAVAASFVWNALFIAYNSITDAVAYQNLRVLKDGIDIDRVAAVFD